MLKCGTWMNPIQLELLPRACISNQSSAISAPEPSLFHQENVQQHKPKIISYLGSTFYFYIQVDYYSSKTLSLWYFSLLNYWRIKNAHSKWQDTRVNIYILITCSVPPPPVLSQSSDTLTIVHGSDAFQWKSTTLSLHA